MSEIGFFSHARTQIPTTGWTAGAWNRDIDISAISGVTVPADATGVVIHAQCASGGASALYAAGVQSSDDPSDVTWPMSTFTVAPIFVKLNAWRTLDFYAENLSMLSFWIVGFTNFIEFVDPLDVSSQVTATGKDTTITASNISSSEAAFALVETAGNATATSRIYPVGGYAKSQPGWRASVNHNIIPLNSSKQFAATLETLFGTNMFRVVGWVRAHNYHYIAPTTQRWPSQNATFEDFPDTVPAGTKFACFIPAPGGGAYNVDIRPKGSSATLNCNPDHIRWSEPDANGAFEYKLTLNGTTNPAYRVALQGYVINQTNVLITGLDDDTPNHGGSLTITGEGFGATQGTGTVTVGGASQTVTSWSDTSITVTVARGTNKYGVALDLVVTNNDSVASTAYSVTLSPQAGWDYVNVGTPNPTASNRITATPDAASGDQLTWDTKSGDVVVYDDLTFSVASGVTSFDVTLWTPVDGWGATATQTIGSGATAVLTEVGTSDEFLFEDTGVPYYGENLGTADSFVITVTGSSETISGPVNSVTSTGGTFDFSFDLFASKFPFADVNHIHTFSLYDGATLLASRTVYPYLYPTLPIYPVAEGDVVRWGNSFFSDIPSVPTNSQVALPTIAQKPGSSPPEMYNIELYVEETIGNWRGKVRVVGYNFAEGTFLVNVLWLPGDGSANWWYLSKEISMNDDFILENTPSGESPGLADLMIKYLASFGYTGTINDMRRRWKEDNLVP